jgi:hypothetical protein
MPFNGVMQRRIVITYRTRVWTFATEDAALDKVRGLVWMRLQYEQKGDIVATDGVYTEVF